MKREGKEVVFENEQPLPKLSLCMGRYQKKEIRLNEVDIELHYFKNHDYWQKEFHPRKDEMVGMLEWLGCWNCFSRTWGVRIREGSLTGSL